VQTNAKQGEVTMPQQGEKQPVLNKDAHLVGEIIEGLARSTALSVEAFLHRGFGSSYIGCGLGAFLVMYVFSTFFQGDDLRPMAIFAGLYGIVWLIAGINALIRRWRKMERVHSRYNGRPHLCRLLPGWQELNVKHLESLLVLFVGFVIWILNRPLGDYLMMAGVFVLVRGYFVASALRDRAVELNNAVIEQREIAEQFRQMQQD
jgi:hypothetical protein